MPVRESVKTSQIPSSQGIELVKFRELINLPYPTELEEQYLAAVSAT